MAQIDNIDPIKSFFSSEKLQLKIFNFLKKNNYKIINKKEYLDKSFDINITKGKPLPQIKNVGFYYMANAMGRLLGCIISGFSYQIAGLIGCFVFAGIFLFFCSVFSFYLKSY